MTPITVFEKKLRVVFGLLLFVMLAALAVSLHTINSVTKTAYWVSHTTEVIGLIEETRVDFNDIRHSIKAYLLTGDGQYLGLIESSRRHIEGELATIRALTGDNPVQQRNVDSFAARIYTYVELTGRMARTFRSEGIAAAIVPIKDGETERDAQAVHRVAGEMLDHERTLLVARRQRRQEAPSRAYGILPSLLGLDLLLAIYMYHLVIQQSRERCPDAP